MLKDSDLKEINWREQLERIIEAVPDGLVIVDRYGYIVFVNAIAEKMAGVPRNNLIGLTCNSFKRTKLNGEPFSNQDLPFTRVIRTGRPAYNMELIVERPDGTKVVATTSAAPLHDERDDIIYVVLSLADITKRQWAEEELRETSQTLQALIKASPQPIIAIDTNGIVKMWNPAAESTFGWSEQEALGGPNPIVPEDKQDEFRTLHDRVLSGESFTGIELLRQKKDGSLIDVIHSTAPLYDAMGNISGGMSIITDITERKRIEKEREELIERIQLLLASTDEGIFGFDNEGLCTFFNRAASEMTGYSPEEVLGKNTHLLFHHSHSDGTSYPIENCSIYNATKTGQGIRTDTEVFWRKDGTSFPVEYSSYPIIKEGVTNGTVVTFTDITERRRAKELSDALNSINAAISSTLDFDEIMRRVADMSAKAIGSEAAVIFLREGSYWVGRYLYGLPPELAQLRLTDEEAKAAAIAARTKKLVVVNDAFLDERVDRKAMEKYNIRSFLNIPLIVREEVVGILYFSYHSAPVAFTEAQVDFANKLGVSISLALGNARLYEAERHIADTLQRSLLAVPEHIEGIDFGYLYRSATELAKVGGDFYDVFELEHGKVGILIGDVSGKGIEATALTTVVKNAVKAHAYEDGTPAKVVSKTNDLLVRVSIPGNFVTLFFGIVDTETGHLDYCSAGHPPAMVKRASGMLDILGKQSPAVGAFSEFHYRSGRATLEKDDVLVAYTDGLIEARCSRGFFGEERLTTLVKETEPIPAKEFPLRIYHDVTHCSGGKLADDVAILAVSLRN